MNEENAIGCVSSPLQARALAFYLPQFHPIPENDAAWGKGFTEWTNVVKARPLYRGHLQPRIPADLGYYDLREPAVREAQANLARQAGIEGFCYWHYWFGNGKQVLERPFQEVLKSGRPDFPFCLAWANESWTGRWHGLDDHVIALQEYPGPDDEKRHFDTLVPAFFDPRYVRVEGRPLFILYRPGDHPRQRQFVELWRDMAAKAGLPGLFLLGVDHPSWNWREAGFDGRIERTPGNFISAQTRLDDGEALRRFRTGLRHRMRLLLGHRAKLEFLKPSPALERHDYIRAEERYPADSMKDGEFPAVISNWDNTPRSGCRGMVFINEGPEAYRRWLEKAIGRIRHRPGDQRMVFIKSWNEWAEGNYLEPDSVHGHAYLEATRRALEGRRANPSGDGCGDRSGPPSA